MPQIFVANQNMHQHFPLVEAGEFAGKSQKRWTDLHEEVSKMINASSTSFSKQEPLIKYLERETTLSNILPQEFKYVSAQMKEL